MKDADEARAERVEAESNLQVYMDTYMHTYKQVYIYTYIYAYIHACTPMYVRTKQKQYDPTYD